MKNKRTFLLILLLCLALASHACRNRPPPTPDNGSPGGGSIGTVSKEQSDVLHATGKQEPVVVESSTALFSGDLVRIANGGIGLLDFGDSLKLRLFNDSDLSVVSATEPGIPLVASLFLTVGGFTGELAKSGGKVVFQTPNKAEITVTGTEFFVGYDAGLGRATAGKWVGSMQVTSAGQTVAINDGYYVDIYPGQPPGEQIPNPLGFKKFEELAVQLNDPLAAVDRIRPPGTTPAGATPPPDYQPTINQRGPIQRGQTVWGEISSPGAMDEYTFAAAPGEVEMVRLLAVDNLRPGFQVYNRGGEGLCDFGADRVAQTFCGLYEGQFKLRVGGTNPEDTGRYALYLQNLTDPVNSTPVAFNQPYDQALPDPLAINSYTFEGSPDNLVLVRTVSTGGEFKLDQWIGYSSQFMNCPGVQRDSLSEIVCPLTQPGTYHLFVDDPAAVTSGKFQLVLNNLSDPQSAPVLEQGVRQPNKIGYPTQVNVYTVFGKQGERREIRALLDSGDLQLHLRLITLDGQIVCEGHTAEKELVVPCTFGDANEYRLVVGDYNGAHTGSYIVWTPPPVVTP